MDRTLELGGGSVLTRRQRSRYFSAIDTGISRKIRTPVLYNPIRLCHPYLFLLIMSP